MRIELEDKDIEAVAEKVIARLKPLLRGNGNGDVVFDNESLAAYLKVEKSWLDQNRKKLNIPHYKLGNQVRYRQKDIDKWLLTRRV